MEIVRPAFGKCLLYPQRCADVDTAGLDSAGARAHQQAPLSLVSLAEQSELYQWECEPRYGKIKNGVIAMRARLTMEQIIRNRGL